MIEVRDLKKNYGPTKALRGVSFDIAHGQIVGLLGPNGAGKSTTMRIVTGYLAPTAGEVRVGDVDVLDDPHAAQSQIGYLPEGNPLYLDLRVNEALTFTASMHGMRGDQRAKAIGESIDAAGLSGRERSLISTLSRGYRQRVGLAQALLHSPPILILDEPTSGLDPNQQEEMRGLMRRLGEERTIVLSTHILPEVEAVCDRALIISNGNLAADGTIGEIRERAVAGSGVRLVVRASSADAERALSGLSFAKSIQVSPLEGDADRVVARVLVGGDVESDLVEQAGAAAYAAGLPISELGAERASLGQVFADLTSGTVPPGVDYYESSGAAEDDVEPVSSVLDPKEGGEA